MIESFTNFPACSKCENRDEDKFTLRYCKGGRLRFSLSCMDVTDSEHLHVECDRCKFEFIMLCSDAPVDIERESTGEELRTN